MTRYAIFRLDSNGGLILASPNQGRYFYEKMEDAFDALHLLRPDMESKMGWTGLCVRPIECHATEDAKSIYAD